MDDATFPDLKNGKVEFQHFRYVIHRLVETYTALGWTRLPALDGTHHDEYACLMRWDGTGEPKEPSHG